MPTPFHAYADGGVDVVFPTADGSRQERGESAIYGGEFLLSLQLDSRVIRDRSGRKDLAYEITYPSSQITNGADAST